MSYRPAVQFRFRSEQQHLAVKEEAAKEGISVNEWILMQMESNIGQVAAPAKVVKAKKK